MATKVSERIERDRVSLLDDVALRLIHPHIAVGEVTAGVIEDAVQLGVIPLAVC